MTGFNNTSCVEKEMGFLFPGFPGVFLSHVSCTLKVKLWIQVAISETAPDVVSQVPMYLEQLIMTMGRNWEERSHGIVHNDQVLLFLVSFPLKIFQQNLITSC